MDLLDSELARGYGPRLALTAGETFAARRESLTVSPEFPRSGPSWARFTAERTTVYGVRFRDNGSRISLMAGQMPPAICNRQSGIWYAL